ncbi:FecR family protein [Celeribacter sp.]|uniref:FecR family protein n=1 Tax=Celeribacter sp. TaxID=1890673 RepID=UPI003A8F21D0
MQNQTSENPASRDALEWLVKLGDDQCDDETRAEFARWIAIGPEQQAAWEEAEALWDCLTPVGAEITALKAHDKAINRRSALGILVGGAAVGLTGWTVNNALKVDYKTAAGETRAITLADGTKVQLGGRTAIGVDFSSHARQVTLLKGEAFFTTSSMSTLPFSVRTMGTTITARDAAFNVNTWVDTGQIAVAAHAVIIEQPNRAPVQVEESCKIEFSSHAISAATVIDPSNIGAWRHGRLVFHSTPLRDVLNEISRYRGGHIALLNKDTGNIPITAAFNASAPEEAIQTIIKTLALKRVDLTGNFSVILT